MGEATTCGRCSPLRQTHSDNHLVDGLTHSDTRAESAAKLKPYGTPGVTTVARKPGVSLGVRKS